MNKKLFAQILSVVVFVLVFYKKSVGINLAIYEIIATALLFYTKNIKRGLLTNILLGATLLTLMATIWHNSTFSLTLNYISFILLISSTVYSAFNSLINVFLLSIRNSVHASYTFLKEQFISDRAESTARYRSRKIQHFVIPAAIIFVFILLYSESSPFFNRIAQKFADVFVEILNLLPNLDIAFIAVLTLAFITSCYIFYSKKEENLIYEDQNIQDNLIRVRKQKTFQPLDLLHEYRSGIFLFVSLNLLLFIVNATDIWSVWFNFNWNGELLKEMVHTGTYILIFAIVLSVILVMYYFRGNLNFLSKNKNLRRLSNLWILQNIILALSVMVRNLRYIEHFSLAYKRIGVLFFLAATLYGLFTVYKKVNQKKSTAFLFRANALGVYITLVVMSLFNWDVIIASYNIKHADRSFLHLDYLSTMPDRCLPLLNKPLEFWEDKENFQQEKYGDRSALMKPEKFVNIIVKRIDRFNEDYAKRHPLEWHYGDWKAYQKLNSN